MSCNGIHIIVCNQNGCHESAAECGIKSCSAWGHLYCNDSFLCIYRLSPDWNHRCIYRGDATDAVGISVGLYTAATYICRSRRYEFSDDAAFIFWFFTGGIEMIINVPATIQSQIVNSVQLDGQSYTLSIYYQPFGQRYYFLITDSTGVTVLNLPLVSGLSNLLKGWFTTSTMTYSATDSIVTILP